jgi:hypothetical protein
MLMFDLFGDTCFFLLLHDYMLAWLALSFCIYHSFAFLVVELIPTFTGVLGIDPCLFNEIVSGRQNCALLLESCRLKIGLCVG